MLFPFRKPKPASPVVYLECSGYSGIVYRVIGSGVPHVLSVEVAYPGSVHRTRLTGFTENVREAQTLALALLEAGATPEDVAGLSETNRDALLKV